MNTRFLVLVGAVSALSLSACGVTSDTSGDGGGGSGGAATTTTATSTGGAGGGTTTTTNAGGGGGAGGAAACGNCLDFVNGTFDDICATDQAAIDAYDALAACTCDAAAGCGAACGDNVCADKDITQACNDCVIDPVGACKTQFHTCTLN